MMAGAHIDEEMLVSVAEHGVNQDTYPHLDECDDCRASVEQYRAVVLSLAHESTWDLHPLDETPSPRTIANLRAYVEQMQREDAEAEPLLAELLAGPREGWMPRLMADEKYRTAGVVRKLIAATDRAIDTMPMDAVEITKLACEIADQLDGTGYTAETVLKLRSAAHRERAYALFYVGDIQASLHAEGISEFAARSCIVGDTEIGRALLVRALVLRQTDNVAEALALTDEAEKRFRAFEDTKHETVAVSTRAYLLSKIGDYKNALAITRRLLDERSAYLTPRESALLAMNLGVYSRELGDVAAALREFEVAAFAFEELGIITAAARMRWNVAALLKDSGDLTNAGPRLESVIADFEKLGMNGTAAVAMLDLAEVRLLQQRVGDVDGLCKHAMQQFHQTGIEYSSRALSALALLREAAGSARVPIALVRSIRRYLDALPSSPALEFAYLPPLTEEQHKNSG
jgi:tetratricopeptide (TPR) repeat protein